MLGLVTGLSVNPTVIFLGMMAVVLFLGCFIDLIGIMMITLPVFMPIVRTLGIEPVWFAVVMMLGMEMATITPPFGMVLFAMKGVAPPGTTMEDI